MSDASRGFLQSEFKSYKKQAKASPCVDVLPQTKITSLLSFSMPSAHTELQPVRKEPSHRRH